MISAKFLNPFIIAVAEVMQNEVGTTVERGSVSVIDGVYLSEDVTVLVSLVGRVEGSVLYGMSYETAKAIVSAILGQEFQCFDELAQSGISELANVITGLSSTKLTSAGYPCIISVPMLIVGKGARISTMSIERLIVPLLTPLGQISLCLALRENPNAPEEFAAYTTQVPTLNV